LPRVLDADESAMVAMCKAIVKKQAIIASQLTESTRLDSEFVL
jgi:hypothetical protein